MTDRLSALSALRRDMDMGLGDARHDYARDFGWPQHLSLGALRRAYERNALAHAAIHKIAARTWRTAPRLIFADQVPEVGGWR